jgi:hypothetical protein
MSDQENSEQRFKNIKSPGKAGTPEERERKGAEGGGGGGGDDTAAPGRIEFTAGLKSPNIMH